MLTFHGLPRDLRTASNDFSKVSQRAMQANRICRPQKSHSLRMAVLKFLAVSGQHITAVARERRIFSVTCTQVSIYIYECADVLIVKHMIHHTLHCFMSCTFTCIGGKQITNNLVLTQLLILILDTFY